MSCMRWSGDRRERIINTVTKPRGMKNRLPETAFVMISIFAFSVMVIFNLLPCRVCPGHFNIADLIGCWSEEEGDGGDCVFHFETPTGMQSIDTEWILRVFARSYKNENLSSRYFYGSHDPPERTIGYVWHDNWPHQANIGLPRWSRMTMTTMFYFYHCWKVLTDPWRFFLSPSPRLF